MQAYLLPAFDVYLIAIVALRLRRAAYSDAQGRLALKFEIDTQHQSHREIFAPGKRNCCFTLKAASKTSLIF